MCVCVLWLCIIVFGFVFFLIFLNIYIHSIFIIIAPLVLVAGLIEKQTYQLN